MKAVCDRLIEKHVATPKRFIERIKESTELGDLRVANIFIELKRHRFEAPSPQNDFQHVASLLSPTPISTSKIIERLCAEGPNSMYYYVTTQSKIPLEAFRTYINFAK